MCISSQHCIMNKLLLFSISCILILSSCAEQSFAEKTSKYDSIGSFVDGEAYVLVGDKMGIIDSQGNEIIKPKYHYVSRFENGARLASIMKEERVNSYITRTKKYSGFLDEDGDEILPFIFDDAQPFLSTGLAAVSKDGKYGMINIKGRYVLEPRFDIVTDFDNGYASIACDVSRGTYNRYLDGKFGIVNDKGEIVVDCQYYYIGSFKNGMATILLNSKYDRYGYVSTSGEILIEPQYTDANSFEGDVARVTDQSSKSFLINSKGEAVSDKTFSYIGQFSCGYATLTPRVSNGVNGYMDPSGKIYSKGYNFGTVTDFYDGCAVVKIEDGKDKRSRKQYYSILIGTDLKPINDERYDSADGFVDGIARVFRKGQGYGFVDTKGQPVIACEYTSAEYNEKTNNLIVCKKNGQTFYFDTKGNLVTSR